MKGEPFQTMFFSIWKCLLIYSFWSKKFNERQIKSILNQVKIVFYFKLSQNEKQILRSMSLHYGRSEEAISATLPSIKLCWKFSVSFLDIFLHQTSFQTLSQLPAFPCCYKIHRAAQKMGWQGAEPHHVPSFSFPPWPPQSCVCAGGLPNFLTPPHPWNVDRGISEAVIWNTDP